MSSNGLQIDVKPGIILEDANLFPKIFPIREDENDYINYSIRMDPYLAYCSPEHFEGITYNEDSYVYSFAMISYAIITGHQPFYGEVNFRLCRDIIHGKRPEFAYVTLLENAGVKQEAG